MPNKNGASRYRLDFSKIPAALQIPNLIEVQKRSYDRFLQMDKLPSERDDSGLQAVFQSVFPISDFRNVSELAFVDLKTACKPLSSRSLGSLSICRKRSYERFCTSIRFGICKVAGILEKSRR